MKPQYRVIRRYLRDGVYLYVIQKLETDGKYYFYAQGRDREDAELVCKNLNAEEKPE